ncbi:hypothetical protein acdb102_42310 [Acidothermaceae bacterium B102]|nr:hypothetical protein acdb102_42310 [Acidothermaceae bacterium B102]
MSTPPVIQLPPPRDPFDLGPRQRTGPGGGANPRRPRMALVVGGVALFWLSALVLPAARPDQPWAHYVGAALLAIVFAGGVLAAATWLRERYRNSRRALLVATPLAALAAGALVAGGVAAAVTGPSPVLSDALAYAAELGLFATVVSALPLPGNDGSAIAFAAVAKRRGDTAAHAAVSRLTLASGFLLVAGGVALLLTSYVGLGIGAMFIGWLGVSAGRQARAQTQVTSALAGLRVSDVAVSAAPLPGWRSLDVAAWDVADAADGWVSAE